MRLVSLGLVIGLGCGLGLGLAACGDGSSTSGADAARASDAAPAIDAVPPDAAPAALGTACTDANACASGFCVDGVCCDMACDEACAQCGTDGVCAPTTGDTCRAAAGDCDVAETCGGASLDCPADELAVAGTACGAYACTGTAAACPSACTGDGDCADGAACLAGGCALVKYAFTTSTTINGNTGGLTGADAFCQARADAAGLPGTYRAWMASAAGAPTTRFTHATMPYVMPGAAGAVVLADDWNDLTDGSIDRLFNHTETGAVVPDNIPWTNVLFTGFADGGPDCGGWTSASTGLSGMSGFSGTTDQGWTQNTTTTCNVVHRLFCFQQ